MLMHLSHTSTIYTYSHFHTLFHANLCAGVPKTGCSPPPAASCAIHLCTRLTPQTIHAFTLSHLSVCRYPQDGLPAGASRQLRQIMEHMVDSAAVQLPAPPAAAGGKAGAGLHVQLILNPLSRVTQKLSQVCGWQGGGGRQLSVLGGSQVRGVGLGVWYVRGEGC